MNKRSFLLGLALSFLGSCGYSYYFFRKSDSPVEVIQNDRSFFSTHRYYNNINQESLEKRLVEIAGETKLEDAWLYNANTRRLLDVGIDEQANQVYNLGIAPGLLLASKKDKLIHYHIHSLNSLSFIGHQLEWKCDESSRDILAKLNSSNSVLAIPSGVDLELCLELVRNYSDYGINTECRIADYRGILSFTIDPTLFSRALRGETSLAMLGNVYKSAYYNFDFTFEEYKVRMAESGIKMDYKRYVSKPITEPTWCNAN